MIPTSYDKFQQLSNRLKHLSVVIQSRANEIQHLEETVEVMEKSERENFPVEMVGIAIDMPKAMALAAVKHALDLKESELESMYTEYKFILKENKS